MDRLRAQLPDQALQLRAQRELANTAVMACLATHAVDDDGQPLFAIKGGVAIELMMGLEARATKDLDAAARLAEEKIEGALTEALVNGWEGFTFRLVSFEMIRDTGARRGDIKVSYQGAPFSTVQFEASPAEGEAGRGLQWLPTKFLSPDRLGLSALDGLPVVTIAYLMAQKLHACTDHSDPDRPNDRARDLIDLILVDRLITSPDERSAIRRACVEIFTLRAKHAWPPSITVLDAWPELYRKDAVRLGFTPEDVHEAAEHVDAMIAAIDGAT